MKRKAGSDSAVKPGVPGAIGKPPGASRELGADCPSQPSERSDHDLTLDSGLQSVRWEFCCMSPHHVLCCLLAALANWTQVAYTRPVALARNFLRLNANKEKSIFSWIHLQVVQNWTEWKRSVTGILPERKKQSLFDVKTKQWSKTEYFRQMQWIKEKYSQSLDKWKTHLPYNLSLYNHSESGPHSSSFDTTWQLVRN